MTVLYCIIFFLFGTIFGSFYHVVGTRLPQNKSIMHPGSHCDKCLHPLKASDLIPIFSYLFHKGRCRYCRAKLSIMHPVIEISTGLLFAVSYYSFGISWDLLLALGIVSLLIIVMVSDLNYFIIPDEVVIFFAIYFLIVQFFKLDLLFFGCSILSGIFLFGVMYFLMLLGNKMFQKESLGGGDIKLMFLVGIVLGPALGLFDIFVGSVLALPVSLFLYFKKQENIIPFGPFLILGFLLLFFMKIDLSTLETLFYFG